MQQFCWRLCFQQNIRNINPMNILNLHMQIITVLIRTTDLIHFAQVYRAPKGCSCYEHWILNITSHSQSLKHNEKLAYDAIYSCSTSSIHTLYSKSSGWTWFMYNKNILKCAFKHYLTSTNFFRVYHSISSSYL